MFGSELKQLVVLDNLKEKLEMLQSDIIPGSESHPVEAGTENTPVAIKSTDGVSFTTTYTTFPLSPLSGRVHFIKDSFLNFSIKVNFGVFVPAKLQVPISFYFGPRDTASIFNQLQILIDNNVIYNTTYQHLESALDFAGLPASVVDHSNNYATIDKLIHMKDTPMKLLTISPSNANAIQYFNVDFQFSIDLNRLCVPLSNIDFITSNMGNLRLRVYMDKFANSFYCFQVPPSLSAVFHPKTANVISNMLAANNLYSLEPVRWGNVASDNTMSNPTYFVVPTSTAIDVTKTGDNPASDYAYTFDRLVEALNLSNTLLPVQFILHPSASISNNVPFMQVSRADICQTCFDLEQSSWDKLCAYFASTGKVIIPIQEWITGVFNNGSLQAGSDIPSTLTASLPGNNITDIAITFTPQNAQSCLLNPYLSNIQALLDGNPLNKVPYNKIDNRAIQDITNACVDTDFDEINTDLSYSLQFPPLVSLASEGKATDPAPRDDSAYFFNVGTDTEFQYYAKLKMLLGAGVKEIKNPNLFFMLFQTALPCSFHTGMCILENSTRIPLIRLTSSGTSPIKSILQDRYPVYYPTKWDSSTPTNITIGNLTTPGTSTKYIYPLMLHLNNTDLQVNVSSLCDMCIVLDYDADLNTCKSAYLSPAKPYLEQ